MGEAGSPLVLCLEVWDEELGCVRGSGGPGARGCAFTQFFLAAGSALRRQQPAGWSTTAKPAPWSSRRRPRCPSSPRTPWRCGSETAAKSATCWGWCWAVWRAAAQDTWCSQVPAALQGRPSAVLRLSSGGCQACTSSPSCASCRLRTAGYQPHRTQAWIPSQCADMCLPCGYCSAGTPWTPMSVATSPQGHPLAWAPHLAPAVAPDPEEGLGTRGPEDQLSRLFSKPECLGWLCLLWKPL